MAGRGRPKKIKEVEVAAVAEVEVVEAVVETPAPKPVITPPSNAEAWAGKLQEKYGLIIRSIEGDAVVFDTGNHRMCFNVASYDDFDVFEKALASNRMITLKV